MCVMTRSFFARDVLEVAPAGGASEGAGEVAKTVLTAVINQRAGGVGLIVGRKSFERPFPEGIELLHALQDVYLDDSITVA